MNNENKVRIRTALVMVYVSIITLLFGINSEAHAQMKEMIVYNKNILYINKYINIVNIKNIINMKELFFLAAGERELLRRRLYLQPDSVMSGSDDVVNGWRIAIVLRCKTLIFSCL